MSRPRPHQADPTGDWVIGILMFAFCVWVCVFSTGCTVRSVTTCVSYSRALQRPDPETFVQKDSGDASVCVETGPRE